MRNRPCRSLILLALAVLSPALSAAQKLDKDDKKWLDDVRPLMPQDEEKTYRGLKDKSDRLEFQKIFWARRDPNLATPENEYQAEYVKARAEADQRYRIAGQAGSTTDCGRTFVLLGKPDDVQQEPGAGLVQPQTWTYKDRPGQTFQGGRATIAFDAECRAPVGFSAQLDQVAMSRVVQRSIDYRKGKDGHLVRLQDQLPKDTPAWHLVRQAAPREDFPLSGRVTHLQGADGGPVVLGVARGGVGAPAAEKTVPVALAVVATGSDGQEAGWWGRSANAEVQPDGSAAASFQLALKPGKYTLKLAMAQSEKGSVTSFPITVPDFGQVETLADGTTAPVPTFGSILMTRGVEDVSENDPEHAYANFVFGNSRLIPCSGSTFTKNDVVSFWWRVYGLRPDPASGKPVARLSMVLMHQGRAIARSEDKPERSPAGGEIGPLPLANYQPGKYTLQLKLSDNIAHKELTHEEPFEIQP